MTEQGVKTVCRTLGTLYRETGFVAVVLTDPSVRLRVRYADPDKTRWQEVAVLFASGYTGPQALLEAAVRQIEETRARWRFEAFKRYHALLRRGLVTDGLPEEPS